MLTFLILAQLSVVTCFCPCPSGRSATNVLVYYTQRSLSFLPMIQTSRYPVITLIYFPSSSCRAFGPLFDFFTASAVYGESFTASGDFRGIEDLCWVGTLLALCHGFLDIVQLVRSIEIVCSCTFETSQAYLSFRRTVAVD